jgi:glycerate kinase
VITGEGRLDAGSFEGKVVGGVTARARALGVPVVAVVGEQTDPAPSDVAVLSLVDLFGRTAALQDAGHCIENAVSQHLWALKPALPVPAA